MMDSVLAAVLLPLERGLVKVTPSQSVLFFGARSGAELLPWRALSMRCVQPYKPLHDALLHNGFAVDAQWQGQQADCVLVLLPRQQQAAQAVLAQALLATREGGYLVVAASNQEGGQRLPKLVQQLLPLAGQLSKYHSRVCWAQVSAAQTNTAQCAQWQAQGQPKRLAQGWVSAPGVFAWDRVDAASQLLAAHLPTDLHGDVADFGAGWGYLAQQVLTCNLQLRSLHLYEADAIALQCARHNLADATVPVHWHWQDLSQPVTERFDAIVMNPPFHAHDRIDRPQLGQAFIRTAAQALRPAGRLWLVANRHLPYENVLAEGFAKVQCHAQQAGYKVIEAVRGA